jgi:septum formation protein
MSAPQIDRDADLILGSGSPRRLELCERLGWRVEVVVADVPEEPGDDEDPTDYAERLAAEKARDVAEQLSDAPPTPRWILSADTIVELEDRILEKPADGQEARTMLAEMSGRQHSVLTSYCLLDRETGSDVVETVHTGVQFRELSAELIERYVATGEPMDKSGSYGIQEFGSLLVDELHGSYFNVMGLPVSHLAKTLETMDLRALHPLLRTHEKQYA